MIHSIKTFYKKCKRFIEFAPEIWNGNDYDYQSAVDLFSYQLERLADELESKNPHVDTKHQVARIHATVEMIQKVYGEEYLERPLHIMERMYGECSFSFKPFEDTDSFEVELVWDRAVDEEHNKEINETYNAMMQHAYKDHERAHATLWKYVEHNIRNWWY